MTRVTRFTALLGLLSLALAATASAGPLDTLQPGQWYEVPNSHLRAVLPNPLPPGDPTNIMGAWSGAAYDTKRDRLLVWGGGHADYGGNEIYAFDLATLTWSRIWGPSPVADINAQWAGTCVETYADGNPVARHTYDGLTYLPTQDRFWIYGGSLTCGSGGFGTVAWTYDLTGGRWERKAGGPGPYLVTSAYDAATGHVFMSDESAGLFEYNPGADAWINYRNAGGTGTDKNATIDPKRRKYVAVGFSEVKMYDLTVSSPVVQTLATTGATAITGTRFPGLTYDPVSDRLVAWSGGQDVYTLNLDTKVWTKMTATNGVIPTAASLKGTYGRWQYVASKNVFVGVNSIDEDVYFYKLAAGGGSTDSLPPSVPANFRPR